MREKGESFPLFKTADSVRVMISVINKISSTLAGIWGLLLLFSSPTSAVTNDLGERQEFTSFISELYQDLRRVDDGGISGVGDYFAGNCNYPESYSYNQKILAAEKKDAERDRGLEFRGSYNSGSLSSEDDSFDDSRASLELSWDLLKDGYLAKSGRAESLELQEEAAILRGDFERLDLLYKCRRENIANNFSNRLINLLEIKKKLIENVHKIERRAYFKKWSFLDDYLVSEADLILINHELEQLYSNPSYDSYKDLKFPEIIQIDFAQLLNDVRSDELIENVFRLEKESLKVEQEERYFDSLRVFLRQEFDFADSQTTDDDLIFGLRFRMPLHLRRDNVLPLRLNQLDKQYDEFKWNRIVQARQANNELQEHLRGVIRQQYRYWRAIERSRRTLLLVQKGENQLLTVAITRINTALDARIELLRSIQGLYERINSTFYKAKIDFNSKYIKRIDYQLYFKRGRMGTRSGYIWSHTFNRIKNNELLDFLHAKSISRVVLSAGNKTDKDKLDEFIQLAAIRNITIDCMVGENNWILPENKESGVVRAVITSEITGALHLDIEPQAMEGYRENRNDYLNYYIELISSVKSQLMGHRFSVAVPFHWDRSVYEKIEKSVDMIYVMAYGSSDTETILRRITPILEVVPLEKINIVLRIEDYKDEWHLENTIDRLISKTGVGNFGLHHVGDLIQLSTMINEAANKN